MDLIEKVNNTTPEELITMGSLSRDYMIDDVNVNLNMITLENPKKVIHYYTLGVNGVFLTELKIVVQFDWVNGLDRYVIRVNSAYVLAHWMVDKDQKSVYGEAITEIKTFKGQQDISKLIDLTFKTSKRIIEWNHRRGNV